ncbi:MAG TPA: VCBS repeat-containing protein [Polyangiaceae bacterium]|nr:VCBS repeat-containing protein [Polyangiaceae bacterium]
MPHQGGEHALRLRALGAACVLVAAACSGRSSVHGAPAGAGGASVGGAATGAGGASFGGAVTEAGGASVEPAPPLPREPALDARFVKITLHREFYCEGASFGDFNLDGVTDVVAGPDWYEGPGYGRSHAIWPHMAFDPHGYSDCFFEWVRDFDGDGWPDVLVVGFPGVPASWYENPQTPDGVWTRHDVIQNPVDNESPAFVDLTGDGEPELVHMTSGVLGWSAPDNGASEPWVFHALSDQRGYVTFTHGLGVGDLDGDGRADVLEATGYFLQPPSLAGDPLWTRVDQSFGPGGAQMPVLDVDGDGDADVVTSLEAHAYGLAWFEQTAPSPALALDEHVIVPDAPPADDAAVIMHEPHAVAVADIDGDGVDDIVSGERFWGHVPSGMPDFDEPARIYWFKTERSKSGTVFTPTLIDDDSGVGTQLTVGDLDGNGSPDIVISNKKGAFVFLQTASH